MSTSPKRSRGPFRADQLHSGAPYELSNGHAIYVAPAGGRHADANVRGAQVLATDPDVNQTGIDAGYSPAPGTLRAPDVAVGNVPAEPGWIQGAPPLAVEYADADQDEDELQAKIAELLDAGTRYLWVVRLAGARRVEVHQPGQRMRLALPGEELVASGVLRNPVRVEALYDPEASMEATLRNLLQRAGYDSLDEVRAEGRARAGRCGATSGRVRDVRGTGRRGAPGRDCVRAGCGGLAGRAGLIVGQPPGAPSHRPARVGAQLVNRSGAATHRSSPISLTRRARRPIRRKCSLPIASSASWTMTMCWSPGTWRVTSRLRTAMVVPCVVQEREVPEVAHWRANVQRHEEDAERRMAGLLRRFQPPPAAAPAKRGWRSTSKKKSRRQKAGRKR